MRENPRYTCSGNNQIRVRDTSEVQMKVERFAASKNGFASGACKQVAYRRRNNGCTVCIIGKSPDTTGSRAFPSQYLDPLSPLPQEFTQPPRGCYLGLYNLLELNSFIALFRHEALPLTCKFISLCRDHKATFKLPASTAGAQKKPLWYKVHWA